MYRCRLAEFTNIVPEQPKRAEENPGEVRLGFEAFMLDATLAGSAQLWIHATIKACIQGRDCLPVSLVNVRLKNKVFLHKKY